MQNKVQNGRRKRVLEAIINGRPAASNDMPINLTTEHHLTGLPKFKRVAMKCLAFTSSHLSPDQRIERLENWNNYLLSNAGLRVLAEEFDKVAKKEAEVQAIEYQLSVKFNIKINENMFDDMCTGQLVPIEMDLDSEPETAPICTLPPQHKEQETPTSSKYILKTQTPTSSKYILKTQTPTSSKCILKTQTPTSSKYILKTQTPTTTMSTTPPPPTAITTTPPPTTITTTPPPPPARSTTSLPNIALEIPAYIKKLLLMYTDDKVPIGPNGSMVSRKALISINWAQSVANVTRKLMMELFDRDTLASHTLSGKPSPAFLGCNKPVKKPLDERKVQDLTHVLTNSLTMTEKEVRQAITTKCADENKMWRQRMQKLLALQSKENRIKN